ncbi:MAG: hypothetical protein R2758_12985 [Bacteroidales bacterium]
MAIKARVLDESDRFYSTLFNLVSHEFRIPIAAIMGASDTLMLSQTSEKTGRNSMVRYSRPRLGLTI